MSLVQREIEVTLALSPEVNPAGENNFGPGTGNTVTLSGLRIAAQVDVWGPPGKCLGKVRIHGMTPAQMAACSLLGKPWNFVSKNGITLRAGDAQSGLSLILQGSFQVAYQDFNSAPDSSFYIESQVGALGAMVPVPPSSYPGSADAAVIMQNIATQMGLNFENSGVQVTLSNPYLPGTLLQQAERLAKAADLNLLIDGDPPTGTLAIWPRTGTRNGETVLLSPETGLVGYPLYTDGGVTVRSLFNPMLQVGKTFQLQSSISSACGTWCIRTLSHDLESQTPGGKWFTTVLAYKQNAGTIQ